MRRLAGREELLKECGEVGVLTEKEWGVDFKGRPYNGNLVPGTSWYFVVLVEVGAQAVALLGISPPFVVQFRRAQGAVHVLYGKVEERGLGEKQLGALISFFPLTSFVLALRKRS